MKPCRLCKIGVRRYKFLNSYAHSDGKKLVWCYNP